MKGQTWVSFARLVVLHKFFIAFWGFIIALYGGVLAHAEVYQWKDAQGHVHFSDTPQTGATLHPMKSLSSIKNPSFNMDKNVLEVPYQDKHGSMLVNVRINNIPMRFILDTGASLVILSPNMAKKAHIDMQAGKFITLQTANGLVRAPQVSIDSVQLGRWQQHHIAAAVQAIGGQQDVGLLGMSFLNAYRMSLDHQRHIITLEVR